MLEIRRSIYLGIHHVTGSVASEPTFTYPRTGPKACVLQARKDEEAH